MGKKKGYGAFKRLVTTGKSALSIVDVVTDVILVLDFHKRNLMPFFYINLAIILLGPCVTLMRGLFLRLSLYHTLLQSTHLGFVVAIFYQLCGRENQARTQEDVVKSYKFTEVIYEAIPEALFQSYVIVLALTVGTGDLDDSNVISTFQIGSLIFSLVSTASAVTENRQQLMLTARDGYSAKAPVFVLSVVEVIIKVACVAIFAASFKGYVFVVIVVQYVLHFFIAACFEKSGMRAVAGRSWMLIFLHAFRSLMVLPIFLGSPIQDWLNFLVVLAVQAFMVLAPQWLPDALRPAEGDPLASPPLARGICFETREDLLDSAACEHGFPGIFILVIGILVALQCAAFLYIQCCSALASRRKKQETLVEVLATPESDDSADEEQGGGVELPPQQLNNGEQKQAW